MTLAANVFPLTIYYESACALCNAEMSNLKLRNSHGRLVFVDVSAPGFSDLPPGTGLAELLTLIHARQADGEIIKGVDVFRQAYSAVGLGWVTRLLQAPLLGRLADGVYPWIARHRHQQPRVMTWIFEIAARRAAQRAHCAAGAACRY